MQTTIIIRTGEIHIYHPNGNEQAFLGGVGEKAVIGTIKKIIADTNRTKAINDVMAKAEMSKGINKLKKSLKPLVKP